MTRSVPNGDLGERLPYDPDFHGPLKNRSCTDVICLLLFLVFVACWGALGWYALVHGDPQTLLVPKDSAGSRCGMDSHVIDRPYLFFFDLTKCLDPTTPFTGCKTPQVCVENCPNTTYINGTPNYGTVDVTPYCTYDGLTCPEWFLPSQSVQKRCIPLTSDLTEDIITGISDLTGSDSSSLVANLKTAINNIKLISQAEEVGQNVVNDIIVSWWKILIGVLLALIFCLIYILLQRWIAGFMVWFSIFGVVALLIAGLYFTSKEYVRWKNTSSEYEEEQASIKTNTDLWLAGVIILSIILGVILLLLIFLRKRILLAIALIKEGSKAVSSVTSVLFFPIFPWIFQVGVIAYAISVGLYLSTTGEPIYKTRNVSPNCASLINLEDNTVCVPSDFIALVNQTVTISETCYNATCKFISMGNDALYPYFQALNVFGFFWLAFFVSAFGQMVLAAVFAQWYWTFDKRDLPFFATTHAIYRTIRYHLGTIAFGSLIIAICRIIRVCLEYLDHKLNKYDNAFVKAILCCLKCFFWCLEKFLKFINKNAYIMCAIHGRNFCASAKDAFMLLMRNILRVFVLDKVTDFLFFLSKVLVTLVVGGVAYVVFATDLVSFVDNSSLNYGLVPVIIIMIVTYLISSIFFSVYSMAVDTLFLCFLEDSERNDGSAEKPFFMSKNLMRIFGKKNKMS